MTGSFFTRDLGKKLLAVILAVGLWFIANIEQKVESTLQVDISYENLPSELVIINNPPDKLTVTLMGTRGQIASLSPKDLRYSIDLSSTTPGISKYEVHTTQIKVPRGIQTVGITPAEIKINVDKLVEKKVAVKPVIGLPDSGYEIEGEPKVEPSVVKVQGPSRLLYNLKSVSTDTVSTTGVKSKFTMEVPLNPPPLVEALNSPAVKVTVNIKERISVKEFKDLDIEFVNFDDLNYEPKTTYKSDLVFEGPYDIIKDLNSENIRVYVDGADLDKGIKYKKQTLNVNVSYPFNNKITLKRQDPKKISLSIN